MSDMIPHIAQANGTISLMIDGTMRPIDTAHKFYAEIRDALKAQNWGVIPGLVNITKNVEEAINTSTAKGRVTVADGEVLYDGHVINNTLANRIVDMARDGFNIGYMVKFLENLMQNPSHRAVNELYDFLAAGAIPITQDGMFLTYKKIRNDWTDIHSGKFDNSIGAVSEMPRNMVDEDSDRTCSAGLHVCSYSYLPHFGWGDNNRVVICEVNPRDVVAIPRDYNNAKMRVCRYVVLSEVSDYKAEDVLAKDAVVFTGQDSPDGFKSVGKDVTAALESGEIDGGDLGSIANRCGLNIGDTNDLVDTAEIDPKWAGKKVAKYLRKGVMDAAAFCMAALEISTLNASEAPNPGTDAPMAPKAVGKSVSASLVNGEVDASQLITIIEDLVNVSTDELDELEHAARTNPKRAGKKIARMVVAGWLDGNALLLGIANLDGRVKVTVKDTLVQVKTGRRCYRCGSTDVDAEGLCRNCQFWN